MRIHIIITSILILIIAILVNITFDISFADQINQRYWPTKEWRTSTPESKNMDSTQLEKMNRYIETKCRSVRSILIVRDGEIIFEKYYSGNKNHAQPIYSVTKSIISALIGIAIDKGYIRSLDQKMVAFFPEYASGVTNSQLKEITIRHLLTMSAGFSGALRGCTAMSRCFEESIVFKPGSQAYYNSSAAHLLSGIISKSTKNSTLEFAYSQMFRPLGIKKPEWSTGIDGYNMGGYGLTLRSRDMAKIGYLYLRNGLWDSNQIISTDWIKESTQKHIILHLGGEEYSYGYLWYISEYEGHSNFSAFGIGGQYIHVFPDLNMVIVTTSDSHSLKPEHAGIATSYAIQSILQ